MLEPTPARIESTPVTGPILDATPVSLQARVLTALASDGVRRRGAQAIAAGIADYAAHRGEP